MGTLPSHHRELGIWSKPAATSCRTQQHCTASPFSNNTESSELHSPSQRGPNLSTRPAETTSAVYQHPSSGSHLFPIHRVDSKPRSTEDAPLAWVQRVPSPPSSPTCSESTLLPRTGRAFLPSPHLLSRHQRLLSTGCSLLWQTRVDALPTPTHDSAFCESPFHQSETSLGLATQVTSCSPFERMDQGDAHIGTLSVEPTNHLVTWAFQTRDNQHLFSSAPS